MVLISLVASLRRTVFSVLHIQTLGATVIAVDSDGSVVLVRNTYGPNVWVLPGGGLRRGETFREGALREACEEAGIVLDESGTASLLGLYLQRVSGWNNHVAVFVVHGWHMEVKKTWEIAEVRRFPLNDLPPNLGRAVLRRIEEWQGKRSVDEHW